MYEQHSLLSETRLKHSITDYYGTRKYFYEILAKVFQLVL